VLFRSIDPVPGARHLAASIEITGLPDNLASDLRGWLKSQRPPADAVPRAVDTESGWSGTRWFDHRGQPARMEPALWSRGQPAPFDPQHLRTVRAAIAQFLRDHGSFAAARGVEKPQNTGPRCDVTVARGDDGAVLTIAFAEFTRIAFDHMDWTGRAGGLFLPVRAEQAQQWWNLRGGPLLFYYLALALMLGALWLCAALRAARIGHYWLAVREDEAAARALGIDVFAVKMKAVLISSAMASVGGTFYAFYYNNLFPAQIFDMSRSIEMILAPIVGGLGTLFGPILGAFILTPLGEGLIAATEHAGLSAPGTKAVFYGLALMAIVWVAPSGVWPWLRRKLGLENP
jgi:hypothetical protein